MKFSGGPDRLVEVIEPRTRSRVGIVEDGEELTSAWPQPLTLSDATQTAEDDEATLRELLMRYSVPPRLRLLPIESLRFGKVSIWSGHASEPRPNITLPFRNLTKLKSYEVESLPFGCKDRILE